MRMLSKTLKSLDARNCEQWREWLARHHDTESEVWLVFYKRHTGRPSIAYLDAVDEALCFGWIDSLIKRLDDDRYARKFTPRKPDSRWSAANRKRFAQLQASGRLTPAGLQRAPTDRSHAPRPSPSKVPQYIQQALRSQPARVSRHHTGACTSPGSIPPGNRKRRPGGCKRPSACSRRARNLA